MNLSTQELPKEKNSLLSVVNNLTTGLPVKTRLTSISNLQFISKNMHLGQVANALLINRVSINNRRYLGNKYKLGNFIKNIIEKECKNFESFADLFAGTGAVASLFPDKKIITNDILYSNYVCHQTWFGTQEFSVNKIRLFLLTYNMINEKNDNYMSRNFSNTYFSKKVCRNIGFIREDIENSYNNGLLNEREKCILITSLLYAMDKIANTCGHYDAYRKNGELDKKLELCMPEIISSNPENEMYNVDINDVAECITADVVYLDPPYNSRQYCDAYHLLENVARWQKPEVKGIAKKLDRTELKSKYCTQNAVKAFEELIQKIDAKYIVLSYNNMAEKGDGRSNAKISDKDIMRILKSKGKVKVFSQKHKAFSAGKSSIDDNSERLFVCTVFKSKNLPVIQSPLNYTGGKFKLLKQILPYFPQKIDKFVDLFCGGCNVGINVNADKIIFNDINSELINLFKTFMKRKFSIINDIDEIIETYGLSQSELYGYEHYGSNGNNGLAEYNKQNYIKLRENFNNLCEMKDADYYYIMLYVLIIFAFNNQIRFNGSGKFNLPVGKRDFNAKMRKKLVEFIERLDVKNVNFTCADFSNFNINKLTENSLVYLDPPYLITNAAYNESGGWNENDEKRLLLFLDKLNSKNIKFALSNVLRNKNKENNILLEWVEKNKNMYKVINLNYNYNNSSYRAKYRDSVTEEVLIINY